MGSERRGRAVHGRLEVNPSGEEPTDRPKQKNAGLWEPYDGRLSRTVLREREGEVPSRHSPGVADGKDSDRGGALGGGERGDHGERLPRVRLGMAEAQHELLERSDAESLERLVI